MAGVLACAAFLLSQPAAAGSWRRVALTRAQGSEVRQAVSRP